MNVRTALLGFFFLLAACTEGPATSAQPSTAVAQIDPNAAGTVQSRATEFDHKLYQAALNAGDRIVATRVLQKIGALNFANRQTPAFLAFQAQHERWLKDNAAFLETVKTKPQAEAYVQAEVTGAAQ